MSESKSFEALFCERHACDTAAFRRRVFWRSLHRRVLPLAPLLMLAGYFEQDRQFIAAAGRARSLSDLRDEIDAYHSHPDNRGFLRRFLRVRISTTRLRRLALGYFAGPTARALAS
jgi:hypothetical protein